MGLSFGQARWLAFLLPLSLLLGAYGSQYIGGLYPCEMCWWQRYPHFAAVAIAGLALFVGDPGMRRTLVALAALALLTSGLIGGFHAGVEYGWWEGLTTCSTTIKAEAGVSFEEQLMKAPLVRCDVAPWDLFGISLAGYNFLLSTLGAIAILFATWRNR